jgi:shikimate kinase
MGSGKSTIGGLVANLAGCPLRDLDAMIEQQMGRSIPEIFERDGEAAFRELEAALLPSALQGEAVVALGGGASLRDDSWRLVKERALSVYLEAPLVVLLQRLGSGQGRPLLGGRSQEEVAQLFEERRPRYEQADYRVDAGRPPELVAEEVLALWRA